MIYRLQVEQQYSDGQKYWNTIKSSRSKSKLVDEAQKMSGRVRVVEDDED